MPQSSSHFSSNPSLNLVPMSVSSTIASIPSFDKRGLDPAQAGLTWLQQLIGILDSTLRLPNTPRAFAVYLLGLAIVFVGAFLHVLVAAQIMQAEFTLSQLREEYRAIEQQNGDIIFQIARDTNMARLHERVVALGYVPVQDREYIIVPRTAAASSATANDTPARDAAAQPVAAAQTIAPNTASYAAGSTSGQWASWEAFWTMTWRAATGHHADAGPADGNTWPAPQMSEAPPANPNFWTVWWEQASEQGSKLLDQLRGQ